MHDLGFVREHMDLIEKMARDRGITLDLEPFKELDAERRKIITSTERMKAERNKANETIAQLKRPSPGSIAGQGDMLPATARMWPATMPFQPTVHDLHQNGRLFPPNYLHESWMDYLYWDSELEP